MASSAAATSSINRANIAKFRKMFDRTANAVPDAVKRGGMVTAMAIKPQWYSIAAANGLPEGSRVARRKWRISDSTRGKSKGTASLIIGFDGPVHLVFGPTKRHLIVAKRLTTRTGARKRTARIGAMAAFGGSNRGTFGKLRSTTKLKETVNGAIEVQAFYGKQALTIPSGSGTMRAYAFHPGTKGKDAAWPAMKAAAVRTGPDKFKSEINKALAANFGKSAASAASAATGGIL